MPEINYLAVLAAAVAHFLLGWLWYGPLFGKSWMAMMGITPESMKSMKMSAITAMIGGFITSFVTVYVLANFVALLGIMEAMEAMLLAFWVWLGFYATTLAGAVLWENKPVKLYVLNASYYLVGLTIAAAILTFWQ